MSLSSPESPMSGLKESRSVDANSSPSVLNECSCDACRNQGSPEAEEDDGKRDDVLNFTSINDFIKDDPKTTDIIPVALSCAVNSFSLEKPDADGPINIYNVRHDYVPVTRRKQRQCTFCKLHGLSASIKGHKTFCQFRENCKCSGCNLIRRNQMVSKNQVRLRRQKEMEVELLQIGRNSDESIDLLEATVSSKRNPMCFKCWVHDSIRVRLKGHRTICPYVRCACANCTLNCDRKRLNRELRQLSTESLKSEWLKEEQPLRDVSVITSGFPLVPHSFPMTASDHQHNVHSAMLMSQTPMTMSARLNGSIETSPVGILKSNNWHVSSNQLYPATYGIKQVSPHFSDETNTINGLPFSMASLPFVGPSSATTTTPDMQHSATTIPSSYASAMPRSAFFTSIASRSSNNSYFYDNHSGGNAVLGLNNGEGYFRQWTPTPAGKSTLSNMEQTLAAELLKETHGGFQFQPHLCLQRQPTDLSSRTQHLVSDHASAIGKTRFGVLSTPVICTSNQSIAVTTVPSL